MALENSGKTYTLLKWNGTYGRDAKFIVRDNSTGKQSVFTPGRVSDLVWTSANLAESSEMKSWEDFDDEVVDDLNYVMM
jgi:hypothetical protein